MSFDLGSLLSQYVGAQTNSANQDAHDHFDQVAQNAPSDLLSQGIDRHQLEVGDAFLFASAAPHTEANGQSFR